MPKKVSYVLMMAFLFTLALTQSTIANSDTRAQVIMEMGANYSKSNTIEITKETEFRVTVRNGKESASWLRFTVDFLEPLIIPGMQPMYLPQMMKEDYVVMGDKVSFLITLKPGKSQLALHSDEGNCKASGSMLLPNSKDPADELELNSHQDHEKVYPIACTA